MRRFLSLFIVLSFSLQVLAVDLLTTAGKTFYSSDHSMRAGIEVEFSGIDFNKATELVQKLLGGTVTRSQFTLKTTIKEIKDGKVIYNEATYPENVLKGTRIGTVILKLDNNQIDDEKMPDSSKQIIEIVSDPLRNESEVEELQKVMTALKKAGAQGTSLDLAVSTQINVEVGQGKIENVDWSAIVDLLRNLYHPAHVRQRAALLKVPANRKPYISPLSPGLQRRILDKRYNPTPREFYNDVLYRQSLEILGYKDAWRMPTERAINTLLKSKNPIVPTVVKQTQVRLSSLLMWAFPNDPLSKLIEEAGWAKPRPLIEWREFNNDFNVIDPYKQTLGLMQSSETYGAYDHDQLMEKISGINQKSIKKIRREAQAKQKQEGQNPLLYRYFFGDRSLVDISEYREVLEAYKGTITDFIPQATHGTKPLHIPGESIVMHRLMVHQNNILGKYNVSLVNPYIVQALENKYVEARFWNQYAPGSMPETVLLGHFAPKLATMNVVELLKQLNSRFPGGWVMKGSWDIGTEKYIVTHKTDVAGLVAAYRSGDFDSFKVSIEKEMAGSQESIEYTQEMLKKHPHYMGWKISQFLSKPDQTIVQRMVPIANEFRVEVVAGEVLGGVSTTDRYKYTYELSNRLNEYKAPPASYFKKAEDFARLAVSQLPPEFRSMTFGMDVAVLTNGQVVMIESNPGANSTFLYEEKPETILLLKKAMEEFPAKVKKGLVHPGLTARQQMDYLKRQFAIWNVNVKTQYTGMTFETDKIVDSYYEQIPHPARKIKTLSCQKVFQK